MSAETAVGAKPASVAHPSATLTTEGQELRSAASGQSQLRRNLKRFLIGNKLNLVGLIIVVVFFFLAIFGQALAPHDPYAQDIIGSKLMPPSTTHPMGTDELGRDLLSRVMTGTRISLQVAAVVLGFAVVFGTLVGAVAGYFGGIVDEVLMRFTDMFLAFPALILAIAIAAALGRELHWTMIALATVFWPWYARLVRGQILSIRERDFVAAAESIGMSGPRVLARHILPNAVSVIIIQLTLDVGYAILATSSLSFIGLGAQPPSPEWGTMMATARNYFREAWWYTTFPGVALTLTVFAFNVLGDGLQDALDPRSGRR
ncbi:MAG TPA: ABC transporter permease [Thermomicrobiales bacterium]|nr:ABC transporter permease [Thermomicrobiales bacterium]